MKKIFIVIAFSSINTVVSSQNKVEYTEMDTKIELEIFTNRIALEMGLAVVDLAKSRNQHIAIEICRLNQTIFLYIDDSLPVDKHNWLRRKANVAKQFEEISLKVKNGDMTLDKTFGLDDKDFIAKGGSIPIFVKNVGIVVTITVSGLHDEEDHKIIIDALKGKYF